MVTKSKKQKSQKAVEDKPAREGPHHRAASKENEHGLACPECWTVPTTIRADGVSTARHPIPDGSKARAFRETEYCNGQGRTARFVVDDPWNIGEEPQVHISAIEHAEHGTTKIEAKLAKRAEREAKAAERAQKPKEPKAKAKSGKGGKKGKATKPKADEPEPTEG